MLREIRTPSLHYFVDENDLTQGEYKRYWSNGRLMEHSFYINDVLHGERKMYYDDGRLYWCSFYQNGSIHGEYHLYDRNGILIRSTFFYNGSNLNVDPSTLTEKDKAYILLSGRLPPRD